LEECVIKKIRGCKDMDFKEILSQILEKFEDAFGILLMGSDGIAIEKVVKNEYVNLDIMAAEYANYLKATDNTLKEAEAGEINEIINITDKLIILLYTLTKEYFLFMVLPAGSNFGRARFELKKAKYVLQKELV
jgi:predicted regulator of Ras-like GTPase activity (Roadblock/LC7/MglB family)